jgi:hypothetical protein
MLVRPTFRALLLFWLFNACFHFRPPAPTVGRELFLWTGRRATLQPPPSASPMTQAERTPLAVLAGLLSGDTIVPAASPQPVKQGAEWWAQKKRKRTVSCGRCSACCREDCGKCLNCTDKPKFGGQGASLGRRPAAARWRASWFGLRGRAACAGAQRPGRSLIRRDARPRLRRDPQAVVPGAQMQQRIGAPGWPQLLQPPGRNVFGRKGPAAHHSPDPKARRPGRAPGQDGHHAAPGVE